MHLVPRLISSMRDGHPLPTRPAQRTKGRAAKHTMTEDRNRKKAGAELARCCNAPLIGCLEEVVEEMVEEVEEETLVLQVGEENTGEGTGRQVRKSRAQG
jgi:hypothetical protein